MDFLDRAVALKAIWAFVLSAFYYLICPSAAYQPAIAAVWIAVLLDIFTRLFANSRKSGGFIKAIRTRTISSDTLFNRTVIKVVAYLSLQILAGLSMKVLPLQQLSIAVATIVYSFLFVREATSVVENLVEAGSSDCKPLLFWLKKKEQLITEGNLPAETTAAVQVAPEQLEEDGK